MYYITDLCKNTYYTCPTESDVIRIWENLNGRKDFTQLNMTGNDTFTIREYTGKYTTLDDGSLLPEVQRNIYLRRYTITDDAGRHVDIRTWPAQLWQTDSDRKWEYGQYNNGGKRNRRRQKGPSLRKRLLRQIPADIDCEDLDITKHQIHGVKIRNKTVIRQYDTWDKYERRAAHGYCAPRCWKDQRKTDHQYRERRLNQHAE